MMFTYSDLKQKRKKTLEMYNYYRCELLKALNGQETQNYATINNNVHYETNSYHANKHNIKSTERNETRIF